MAQDEFSEDDLLDHVHGRAGDAMSVRIAARIERDPDFAAEMAVMRALGPALAGADARTPQGDFGWQRLSREIERDALPVAGREARSPHRLWRIAAVVMGALALGEGALLLAPADNGVAPLYGTASSGMQAEVAGPVLAVVFQPDATIAEIHSLLRTLDARIIDGPGAINLYHLELPVGADPQDVRHRLDSSPLVEMTAEVADR